ncbi:MAG: OB-fold nucleic acid binding domain-containing protein [Candidatus Aenigmarchaeota archaeon]|nr:OB-fold nucleic acid binding domain-containing protein [Candidatus Aenigmarchaeota archaeon]
MDLRQVPARVQKIKEIDISKDARVRILGKILSKAGDSFVIEDDTGKIDVFSTPEIISRLYDGQIVRVYAQVAPDGTGNFNLRAELVLDATGIDINLYKLAEKMWIKANS